MLTGDNGVLQKTVEAKEKSERAEIIEKVKLDILGEITGKEGDNLTEGELKNILSNYFKDIPEKLPEDLSSLELTTKDEKHTIKVFELYDRELKPLESGLYYAGTDNLIMSWDQLLDSKGKAPMLTVNSGTLVKASFNIDTQVKLVVDKTVTSIGYMSGISQLAEIKLPDTITTLKPGAFSGCSSLEKVNLGNKVTSIDSGAFISCSSLKKIEIPDSVTSLGDSAFEKCTSLEEIKIGNGGVNINQSVFGNDYALKTIEIKAGTIGAGAFNGRGELETVKLGKDVDLSATSIFGACKKLKNVILEDGITTIGEFNFGQCEKLTSIKIPNSVTSIGDRAFQSCPLNSIYVNSKDIGEEAFEYTSSSSIIIGQNVRNIGKRAFNQSEIDGSPISITVQDGLTTLGKNSFEGLGYHASEINITLPQTLKTIEKEAFTACVTLKTIKIPKSVTSIADDAFKDCTALKNIILENGSSLTAPENKWGATSATVMQE